MDDSRHTTAWNTMVTDPMPDRYEPGDARRDAAIACLYMGGANNGGLNAFLTNHAELDTQDVLQSLRNIGATAAAEQLHELLQKLGRGLAAASYSDRCAQLDTLWTEDLDALDTLTPKADDSLLTALNAHLADHIEHYLNRAPAG